MGFAIEGLLRQVENRFGRGAANVVLLGLLLAACAIFLVTIEPLFRAWLNNVYAELNREVPFEGYLQLAWRLAIVMSVSALFIWRSRVLINGWFKETGNEIDKLNGQLMGEFEQLQREQEELERSWEALSGQFAGRDRLLTKSEALQSRLEDMLKQVRSETKELKRAKTRFKRRIK